MLPALRQRLHRLYYWLVLYKKVEKIDRTHGTDVTEVERQQLAEGAAISKFPLIIRQEFFYWIPISLIKMIAGI